MKKSKKCPKCENPKPISEFGKDKYTKDGLDCYCKEHKKEYRDHNKEKIKAYRYKIKEWKRKYDKKYNIINKEKIARKNKKWFLENKNKVYKYQRNKKQIDIIFKVACCLRTRIWESLNGRTKSMQTMFLIGCDMDYLMYHLQCKFTKGMSWDNYGAWHIDHIKPCTLFDLSKKSEQLECFNYKNLQPLWAEDNWKKGCKYDI